MGKQEYLPTLLYRLQDDEPKSIHDRQAPVDSRTMRYLVQKDIADLLNHTIIGVKLKKQFVISCYGLNLALFPNHYWYAPFMIEMALPGTLSYRLRFGD